MNEADSNLQRKFQHDIFKNLGAVNGMTDKHAENRELLNRYLERGEKKYFAHILLQNSLKPFLGQ